jgi:hypothetical protein
MNKIMKIMVGIVVFGMATVSQASTWTNAAGWNLSTAGNWDTYPTNGVTVGGFKGTSTANHAILDAAFSSTNTPLALGNFNINPGGVAGTAYLDVASGALLKAVNVFVGNGNQLTQAGSLTLKSGSALVANAVNSGALFVGQKGPGTVNVESGVSFSFATLILGTNGVVNYTAGADSISTFVASRTTTGSTNLLDGLIQVDLGALTTAGSYTLVDSSDADLLIEGNLKTWLDGNGGVRSGTGSFASTNFAVLNGGSAVWNLTTANSGQDLVLNVTAIPEPATLGLFGLAGLVVLAIRHSMRG